MDASTWPAMEIKPAEPWSLRWSSEARAGSITVIWLPVSTIKSYGPAELIFTGITIRAPCTIRGTISLISPGQRVFAEKAGRRWVVRTKEVSHLRFVIAEAPQPGWLRKLWAHGSTWS